MTITDTSNWLSFNLYFSPKTLIGDISDYQKWYFKFLKDILKPFLEKHEDSLNYVYFGDYFFNKPVDNVIISEVNLREWVEDLEKLRDENHLSQIQVNQLQERFRYIRLRYCVLNGRYDEIIKDMSEQLKNIEYFLGFELVKYDVISDLGRRYSSKKQDWEDSPENIERLRKFIIYWDSICRYILTIITEDYCLDFENVDIPGILHLGFHSLGSKLPIKKCERCKDILYFLTNERPVCWLQCKCGTYQSELLHL